jgi:hypothetical protein
MNKQNRGDLFTRRILPLIAMCNFMNKTRVVSVEAPRNIPDAIHRQIQKEGGVGPKRATTITIQYRPKYCDPLFAELLNAQARLNQYLNDNCERRENARLRSGTIKTVWHPTSSFDRFIYLGMQQARNAHVENINDTKMRHFQSQGSTGTPPKLLAVPALRNPSDPLLIDYDNLFQFRKAAYQEQQPTRNDRLWAVAEYTVKMTKQAKRHARRDAKYNSVNGNNGEYTNEHGPSSFICYTPCLSFSSPQWFLPKYPL